MAAPEVRAIDQQTAHPGGAHLGERDFLADWLGHGPMMTPIRRTVKPLDIGSLAAWAHKARGGAVGAFFPSAGCQPRTARAVWRAPIQGRMLLRPLLRSQAG
jgi:hypothetical protein